MIKSDRRGLLFLISLLVVISALIGFLADTEYSSDNINYPTDSTLHLNLSRHDEDVADAYALPSRKVETFCFDPNTADSTQLLRLDFSHGKFVTFTNIEPTVASTNARKTLPTYMV